MTVEELQDLFKKYSDDGDEFLKFDRVPEDQRVSNRADLNAFLLLDALVPSTHYMVAGATHDEIWLQPDIGDVANAATEDQIVTLIRCGVMLDADEESFAMFV